MKKRRFFLFFLFVVLLAALSSGHGFILFDVSLDYDAELKAGVTAAAQEFLGLDEEPIRFDYDNELIIARFDRKLELSVAVNPLDFSIRGFRDDSLVNRKGKSTFTEAQMKAKAEEVLRNLPDDYVAQLKFAGSDTLYQGTTEFTWNRHIGELAFIQERVDIEVDPVEGKIVFWQANHFFYDASFITTAPAFSAEVAQEVVNLYMKGESTDITPVLTVIKNSPLWLVQTKKLYPVYMGIDALTGKPLFSGGIKGALPQGYSYQGSEVVESSLIQQIYGGDY